MNYPQSVGFIECLRGHDLSPFPFNPLRFLYRGNHLVLGYLEAKAPEEGELLSRMLCKS